MKRLLRYLVLPSEVTPFEARYLARMNRIALGFFWLHPPVFALVAMLSGTSLEVAVGLALAAMVGPMIAYFRFNNRPRVISMIYGVTAMLMGGALVFIGHVPFETTLRDGELHLAISDDGPGIAWDQIAARARSLGLPADTAHDLEQALFASGISTRDEVSETSGRGVGMDALRTSCSALGGSISVISERGRGTRITCIVPVAAKRARRASQLSQPLPVLA